MDREIQADVAVVGGGLGGVAAALAAARLGARVVMTEALSWIGGQLTTQAVPPDEHPWVERFGISASYRSLRQGIRAYYRRHLPLTPDAMRQRHLNPGNGWVSRLCHDPRVAHAVLHQLLAPYLLNGRLTLLCNHTPVAAEVAGDHVRAVTLQVHPGVEHRRVVARLFIDATEHGDVLALAGAEHVMGAESQAETGEPHAAARADPLCHQAITFCFALEHLPGEDHTGEPPPEYAHWRNHQPPNWPGRLLDWRVVKPETGEPMVMPLFPQADEHSLWGFRRILDRSLFVDGFARGDVTLVNWPQNDYRGGPVFGVPEAERQQHLRAARALSLSLVHWLQTEAPRPDGGLGYPGLRLRADVVGNTADGLAPAPYVRESRRIRAELTVVEQHLAHPLRPHGPELFPDAVGIGSYRIDLHPRTSGAGYLDLGCWPFQIPLRALLPVRVENLLPGCKNLGVSHIANGAFRVHPVEWSVGEAAGLLAAYSVLRKLLPRQVRMKQPLLQEFQALLTAQGIPLQWPRLQPL